MAWLLHFPLASAALLLVLFSVVAADRAPVFTVHSAGGPPIKGEFVALNADWSVRLFNEKPVPGADLIALRRVDMRLPGPPTGPQVIFANGDRLPGAISELKGDKLGFTLTDGPLAELTLPLSALSVLWFADPADLDRPDPVRRRLLLEKRNRDLVVLRNGDQLQGNLLQLDRQALVIEVDGKEVKVDRNQAAYVALNNELVQTLRPKAAYALLLLRHGSRLSVSSVQTDERKLRCKTLFGATLTVAVDQLVALTVYQGRAVYLSDLKPSAYQYTPFLTEPPLPWVADGSVSGGELRLAGDVHVKGLGMHSQSRITYKLDGAYRRFEASVGLDEASLLGSVRVGVLVDSKMQKGVGDKELTQRDGVREVQIDLTGARELTLVVEHGKARPFVQGRVNWADARLIR